MTLHEYLTSSGIRVTVFAAKIGVKRTTLIGYISGRRTVPLAVAVRIAKATKGKVKAAEMTQGDAV